MAERNDAIKHLKVENNFLKNQLAENSVYLESELLIDLHQKMKSFESAIQSLKQQNDNYLETIQNIENENFKL